MRFSPRYFVLVLLAGVLGGCASNPTEPRAPASGRPITDLHFPKDDLGREVKLQKPAQRVVCIGPGATETIFALGAGSKLVGRDQISDYPKEALKLPIAGDYTGPFVEKVIALNPDLVIVQGETYDKARAENWQKKIGIPVAILVPTSVEKVADGMKKIGVWLGSEKAAGNIVASFRPYLGDRGLEGAPKGFFEVQRSPLWTAGKGTLVYSVMANAGVAGAFEIAGYKQYNLEFLLTRNPDLYIVSETKPDRSKTLRELRSHSILKKLRCVREGAIVVLPADWVLRPGPRLILGIKKLRRQADNLRYDD